jgi:hypothetical protein
MAEKIETQIPTTKLSTEQLVEKVRARVRADVWVRMLKAESK